MMKIRFEAIDQSTGEVFFRGVSTTPEHPCPRCHKPTHTDRREGWCCADYERGLVWCGHSADESSKAFYRIGEGSLVPRPRKVIITPTRADVDFDGLVHTFQQDMDEQRLNRLAVDLGVSEESLVGLGAGWASGSRATSFPMRDWSGIVIGIRLRRADGLKFAVKGSRNGLFFNPLEELAERVLICEGPTDAAALMDLGYSVIGRPGCRLGGPLLVRMLRGRDVVIVGDSDVPKTQCQNCSRNFCQHCRPGQHGAWKLADELLRPAKSVKVIFPIAGHKDARSWAQAGATRATVDAVIQATDYWSAR